MSNDHTSIDEFFFLITLILQSLFMIFTIRILLEVVYINLIKHCSEFKLGICSHSRPRLSIFSLMGVEKHSQDPDWSRSSHNDI